jgi:hypothetical protein
VFANGIQIASGTVHDGVATVRLPIFEKPGTQKLDVRHLGTSSYAASSTSVSVKITKKYAATAGGSPHGHAVAGRRLPWPVSPAATPCRTVSITVHPQEPVPCLP